MGNIHIKFSMLPTTKKTDGIEARKLQKPKKEHIKSLKINVLSIKYSNRDRRRIQHSPEYQYGMAPAGLCGSVALSRWDLTLSRCKGNISAGNMQGYINSDLRPQGRKNLHTLPVTTASGSIFSSLPLHISCRYLYKAA